MFENTSNYDYGLWPIVIANVLLAVFFLWGFLRPRRRADWQSMGMLQAFVVALFAEMYGFPLTIYFLSSILGLQLPVSSPFNHQAGHLLATLGFGLNAALLICTIGNYLVFGGVVLLAGGWWQIFRARGSMVTNGLYRFVRHPQYTGIILTAIGFLIQWPTLLTLLLFPFVVLMYVRLARMEEREAIQAFGDSYRQYLQRTSAFIPGWPRSKG